MMLTRCRLALLTLASVCLAVHAAQATVATPANLDTRPSLWDFLSPPPSEIPQFPDEFSARVDVVEDGAVAETSIFRSKDLVSMQGGDTAFADSYKLHTRYTLWDIHTRNPKCVRVPLTTQAPPIPSLPSTARFVGITDGDGDQDGDLGASFGIAGEKLYHWQYRDEHDNLLTWSFCACGHPKRTEIASKGGKSKTTWVWTSFHPLGTPGFAAAEAEVQLAMRQCTDKPPVPESFIGVQESHRMNKGKVVSSRMLNVWVDKSTFKAKSDLLVDGHIVYAQLFRGDKNRKFSMSEFAKSGAPLSCHPEHFDPNEFPSWHVPSTYRFHGFAEYAKDNWVEVWQETSKGMVFQSMYDPDTSVPVAHRFYNAAGDLVTESVWHEFIPTTPPSYHFVEPDVCVKA